MDIHAQIWVFGGSLAAILLLVGFAAWLKLGGSPVIASEEDARRLADEVRDGFLPERIAIDAQGAAALLDDGAGRIMLIKRHGNRFAGRILPSSAHATLEDTALVVFSGEARFGKVALAVPEAGVWAEAINGLRVTGNA
jgi:hypothetical protein